MTENLNVLDIIKCLDTGTECKVSLDIGTGS